ncbi:MAG TPA: hypothetical protein VN843_29260 [Anaerolineales bacterium]|nr:hypothetical protein [Anaerolineales bacterium]
MSTDKIPSKAPLVEYGGIQILYLEDVNKWRFELRGRERKADSLKQAKEWIDKPEPVKKASKPFERFEAYLDSTDYYGTKRTVEVVTVTSVAQDTYRGTNIPCVAWIVRQNKERTKVNVEKLFEISEGTKQKLKSVNELFTEAETVKKRAEAVFKSIKRVDLSEYVDNGDE